MYYIIYHICLFIIIYVIYNIIYEYTYYIILYILKYLDVYYVLAISAMIFWVSFPSVSLPSITTSMAKKKITPATHRFVSVNLRLLVAVESQF